MKKMLCLNSAFCYEKKQTFKNIQEKVENFDFVEQSTKERHNTKMVIQYDC